MFTQGDPQFDIQVNGRAHHRFCDHYDVFQANHYDQVWKYFTELNEWHVIIKILFELFTNCSFYGELLRKTCPPKRLKPAIQVESEANENTERQRHYDRCNQRHHCTQCQSPLRLHHFNFSCDNQVQQVVMNNISLNHYLINYYL